MANEEHLAILMQGVEVWNQWRKGHPDTIPDLSRAILIGADLGNANLSKADLSDADLGETNLSEADLSDANLTRANLGEANFFRANLSSTNLRGAQLRWATFGNANLTDADFDGANLNGVSFIFANLVGVSLRDADLHEARVAATVFADMDLSETKGLDAIVALGPSTIGLDTVYRSRGKISEIFLRGCGVPDELIRTIHDVFAQPIQFYSCFISYSACDQEFANRLYADLQAKGVRCWFAPEDMKIGDKIWDRLDQSIRLHDKLLLVLSANSIGSEWVEDEVTTAFEEERRRSRIVLFPVRLDDAVMETDESWAAKVRQRHIGDFRDWKNHDSYRKAFDRLLRDLKAETDQAAREATQNASSKGV